MENTSVAFSAAQSLTTETVPLNTAGAFLHEGITAPKPSIAELITKEQTNKA